MIEAQVREWCEQILVEVVLAARNSHGARSSSTHFCRRARSPPPCYQDSCCTPRYRDDSVEKLGPARSDHAESTADPGTAHPSHARSRQPGSAPQQRHESGEQAT